MEVKHLAVGIERHRQRRDSSFQSEWQSAS